MHNNEIVRNEKNKLIFLQTYLFSSFYILLTSLILLLENKIDISYYSMINLKVFVFVITFIIVTIIMVKFNTIYFKSKLRLKIYKFLKYYFIVTIIIGLVYVIKISIFDGVLSFVKTIDGFFSIFLLLLLAIAFLYKYVLVFAVFAIMIDINVNKKVQIIKESYNEQIIGIKEDAECETLDVEYQNKAILNSKKSKIIIIFVISLIVISLLSSLLLFISNLEKYSYASIDEEAYYDEYILYLYKNKKVFIMNKETKRFVKLPDLMNMIIDNPTDPYLCFEVRNKGKNIMCNFESEFYSFYLYDGNKIISVDEKGNILNIEKVDCTYCADEKTFSFGMQDYTIINEENNKKFYVQHTGTNRYNIFSWDDKGKLEKIIGVEDYYLLQNRLFTLEENKFKIYKDMQVVYESKKYDKIYDSINGKYIAIKENETSMIVDNEGNEIMRILDNNIDFMIFKQTPDNKVSIVVHYNDENGKLLNKVYYIENN